MRRLVTICFVAMLGCQDVDDEPHFGRLVVVGESVEIWASPGMDVCGGNVAYMDAFVDALREEVGPHPANEDLHRVYVLNQQDWRAFDDAVDCRGAGCTTASRTVYTSGFLPGSHELVHAELFTNGHRFLEEGLAVVYGGMLEEGSPRDYEIIDGLSESWVEPEAYARAGHFAKFVIDRHGIDAFMNAKDASSYGDSFDDVLEVFAQVLGEPAEELLAAYDALYARCRQPGYQAMLVECEQQPTPWTEEDYGGPGIRWNLDFGCADGNTLGPTHDGRVYVTRAFELDREVEVLASLSAPEGVELTISRCDGSCTANPLANPDINERWTIEVGRTHGEYLAAGRYTAKISKPIEMAPAPVEIWVRQFEW